MFDGKQFTNVQTLNEAVLKLLYRSIFHFLEHLKVITMITDDLERKINKAMENKFLLNLFTLEKSLVYYLNSINSNGGLIERLKNNSAKLGFTTGEIELLDDLIIENNQCYRQSEIHSNILASLMDARASIVGNNLNVLMKTLNIIMLGIMVPTLVVSIFSMNVPIPGQEHPHLILADSSPRTCFCRRDYIGLEKKEDGNMKQWYEILFRELCPHVRQGIIYTGNISRSRLYRAGNRIR